jgi:hypothetical protein
MLPVTRSRTSAYPFEGIHTNPHPREPRKTLLKSFKGEIMVV